MGSGSGWSRSANRRAGARHGSASSDRPSERVRTQPLVDLTTGGEPDGQVVPGKALVDAAPEPRRLFRTPELSFSAPPGVPDGLRAQRLSFQGLKTPVKTTISEPSSSDAASPRQRYDNP